MAFHTRKRSGRRAGSHRTCQGCHGRIPLSTSLRIIRDTEGNCRPDFFGKLPGRGMRLCPDLACFTAACRHQAASRAFRRRTSFGDPRSLATEFLESSRKQALAQLSVARRSGFMVAGRTAVVEALQAGRGALVLLATDGSISLKREIGGLTKDKNVPAFSALDKQSLSSFHNGKPLAVLAISHRGVADRLGCELKKMCRLRDSLDEYKESAT